MGIGSTEIKISEVTYCFEFRSVCVQQLSAGQRMLVHSYNCSLIFRSAVLTNMQTVYVCGILRRRPLTTVKKPENAMPRLSTGFACCYLHCVSSSQQRPYSYACKRTNEKEELEWIKIDHSELIQYYASRRMRYIYKR